MRAIETGSVLKAGLIALVLFASTAALAQAAPQVSGAWVRGTVPGQRSTGAFMVITSVSDTALVGVVSPVARLAQVHQVVMDGNVMRMREVDRVALHAGTRLELKPGGYHVMLMDLQQPLRKGDKVPLKLVFEGQERQRSVVDVQAEVLDVTATGPAR